MKIAKLLRALDELEKPINTVLKETSCWKRFLTHLTGDRAVCRIQECDMGNMIADAMRDAVIDKGYTIALANSGGIRASLDAGDVTLGEIMTILPFQNTLSTFKVTGEQLLTAIENGVSQIEDVAGKDSLKYQECDLHLIQANLLMVEESPQLKLMKMAAGSR